MNKKLILGIVFISLFSILFSFSVYSVSPTLLENSTWSQNLTGLIHSTAIFGDIDNDGDIDIITAGCKDGAATTCTIIGKTRIYENNGSQFLENTTWQQNLTNVSWSSLALGDIDNDGDLDLALTGYDGSNGITKIYENNGSQFLENTTWQQNLTTTKVYQGAVAFGDIDNDGDLDLGLIGADSANENGIYINNGTSFIKNKKWLINLPKVGQGLGKGAIVFGDYNNDGDLDLLFRGGYGIIGMYHRIYINNGTSLVQDSVWGGNFRGQNWASISIGDIDNDGDLDFATIGTGQWGDTFYIYENNNTSFNLNQTEDTPGPLVGMFDGSIGFGDYDNDGDLDLVGLGKEAGSTRTYLNNNTRFDKDIIADSNISNSLVQGALAWSDVDNDSNLDLITIAKDGTNYISKVYTNNLTNNPNEYPTPPIQFTNYTNVNGNIHLGWMNGSDNETPSSGLYYNIRFGSTQSGNEIITGVYGGGEDNGYFGNMMQRKNFTLKSNRLLPNTVYYWSVQVIDTGLQKSAWSTEQNFTTSGDLTPPTITLNAPINNYNSSSYTINFNITSYDNINVSNITLWGNWTGSFVINETNSSILNNSEWIVTQDLTNEGDGYYKWGISSCDNSSLCSVSSNRTLSIDTTYPEIYLISPSNNSEWTSSNTINFEYNVTGLYVNNCSLIINGAIDQINYNVSIESIQLFSKSLSNGYYNWSINCTDQVYRVNSSDTNKLIVAVSKAGGGGASARSNYYRYNLENNNCTLIRLFSWEISENDYINLEKCKIKIKEKIIYFGLKIAGLILLSLFIIFILFILFYIFYLA